MDVCRAISHAPSSKPRCECLSSDELRPSLAAAVFQGVAFFLETLKKVQVELACKFTAIMGSGPRCMRSPEQRSPRARSLPRRTRENELPFKIGQSPSHQGISTPFSDDLPEYPTLSRAWRGGASCCNSCAAFTAANFSTLLSLTKGIRRSISSRALFLEWNSG